MRRNKLKRNEKSGIVLVKMSEIFSNNLKKILSEKRVSQTDLAGMMNSSDTQVSRWTSGSIPSLLTLAEICASLNVAPCYFFNDQETLEAAKNAIETLRNSQKIFI